jgi:hypothetical protein
MSSSREQEAPESGEDSFPSVPPGWSVERRRSTGPFTTHVRYRLGDGRLLEWSSRAHRKRASAGRGVPQASILWAPRRVSWWIAVLFVIGSACFLVGPLPKFIDLVGGRTDGLVFFVGSLFFTSAASLQWWESVNVSRGPASAAGRRRLVSWEPHRIDWWASGVQLIGTVFFNLSTFHALATSTSSAPYDHLVWRPDSLGSVCFLVSGALAYVEVAGGLFRPPGRTLDGTIVTVNLLGCVAFAVSAVAAFVAPATGHEVAANLSNTTTALGALGFLVGALLLFPESRSVSQSPT